MPTPANWQADNFVKLCRNTQPVLCNDDDWDSIMTTARSQQQQRQLILQFRVLCTDSTLYWTFNKQVNSSTAQILQLTFTVSERKAATSITADQANSLLQTGMIGMGTELVL